MLRILECSDLAEPSFSIRLYENGVLGNRARCEPWGFYLAYEGPMKTRESGDKSTHSKEIAQHQN